MYELEYLKGYMHPFHENVGTFPEALIDLCRLISSNICQMSYTYMYTRSLGALRAPTSSLRPFGPA